MKNWPGSYVIDQEEEKTGRGGWMVVRRTEQVKKKLRPYGGYSHT